MKNNPEFNLQIKFLNSSGIFKSVPLKWKIRNKFYQLFILFCVICTIFMECHFILTNFNDVFDVAEVLGPVVSFALGLIKYLIFLLNSRQVFTMMDEIVEMNKTCE